MEAILIRTRMRKTNYWCTWHWTSTIENTKHNIVFYLRLAQNEQMDTPDNGVGIQFSVGLTSKLQRRQYVGN